MALATLTSKGQVTIPKVIRDSLQLQAGDKVEFVLSDAKEALFRPITKKVDEVFGRLYRPGRNAASVEQMDAGLKRKLRAEKT
jgi:AbrB family looped-hinge helix DNA binding protein